MARLCGDDHVILGGLSLAGSLVLTWIGARPDEVVAPRHTQRPRQALRAVNALLWVAATAVFTVITVLVAA